MSSAMEKQNLFRVNNLAAENAMLMAKVTSLENYVDQLTAYQRKLHIRDAAYSWWMTPLAIFRKGVREQTYLGFIDSAGNQCVASIDHVTGKQEVTILDTESEIDDHNPVSINLFNSGKPIVAYTRHGSDNIIRFRIGRNRESVRSFEDEVRLPANSNTTYAQLFRFNAVLIIFYRTNALGWCFRRSTDSGQTWENERRFVNAGSQYYVKFIQKPDEPNLIRFAMTGHPTNSPEQDIYVGSINLATDQVRGFDGTLKGSLLNDHYQPLDFQLGLTPPEGQATRLLDVGYCEDFRFAYCTWDNSLSDFSDAKYWVARWTGSEFIHEYIVHAGYPIDPNYATSRYFGGVHFVSRSTTDLYLSREADGEFIIEHWTKVGSDWEINELARDGEQKLYRPISPIDADNRLPVFWQRGMYQNFALYNVDIVNF